MRKCIPMLALLLILSVAEGRNVTNYGTAIIGESALRFYYDESNASTYCDGWICEYGTPLLQCMFNPSRDLPGNDTNPQDWTNSSSANLAAGVVYNATDCGKTNETNITFIQFANPDINARTLSSSGQEVNQFAIGETVILNATSNLYILKMPNICKLAFVVKGPNSNVTRLKVEREIDVSGNASYPLDTREYSEGDYTLTVSSNSSTCNGVSASSNTVRFTLSQPSITLNANPSTQAVREEITLSGTTQPYKEVWLNVTSGDELAIWFIGGKGSLEDKPSRRGNVSVVADSNGQFSAVINATKSGSYEIQAGIDCYGSYENCLRKASVWITIEEPKATVSTERKVYVSGEKVKISGTATAGDFVLISIDDRVVFNNTAISNGKFEAEWNTAGVAPRSYTIKVWLCGATVNATQNGCEVQIGADTSRGVPGIEGNYVGSDAATVVTIEKVRLEARVLPENVAVGDSIKIKGEAPGAPTAYYWIFNSKGTAGGICRSGSIPVKSDYTFEKVLSDVADELGVYTVFVQTLGRDRIYSDGKNVSDYACNDQGTTGALANKNGDQIRAILEDNVKKAGSDDYEAYAVLRYVVSTPFIKLNPCPETIIGQDLVVTGTTNREDGTDIVVSISGPTAAPSKIVKSFNGSFVATWITSGFDAGEYTITADDMENHIDHITCKLVYGALPVISPSISADNLYPGVRENVTVSAQVRNSGTLNASGVLVRFYRDGEVLRDCERIIDVSGQSSETLTCIVSFDTVGVHSVMVETRYGNETLNDTVEIYVGVTPTATPTATPTETPAATPTPTQKPPGFEAVFAIAGLLVAYLLSRRK